MAYERTDLLKELAKYPKVLQGFIYYLTYSNMDLTLFDKLDARGQIGYYLDFFNLYGITIVFDSHSYTSFLNKNWLHTLGGLKVNDFNKVIIYKLVIENGNEPINIIDNLHKLIVETFKILKPNF